MDRIKKIQIGYIAIGLFLIALPFLINRYCNNIFLFFAFWGIGVLFVLNGIIYRTSEKLSKKRTNKFEYRKGKPKTDSEVISIIGFIVFCLGLGVGLVSAYERLMFSFVELSLLLCGVGCLVMFISSIFVREERRKEREKFRFS